MSTEQEVANETENLSETKEADAKADQSGEQSKQDETPKIDPQAILKSVEEEKANRPEMNHNFDKGLRGLQEKVNQLSRDLSESRETQKATQKLLADLAKGRVTEKDALDQIGDEDLPYGKTIRESLKALRSDMSKEVAKQVAELKEANKELVKQQSIPREQPLSSEQIVERVADMFPDLAEMDDAFIPHIIETAAPQMEAYKAQNPNATAGENKAMAEKVLSEQAYKIRLAIARQQKQPSGDSGNKEGSSKASAGTKIKEYGASPATTANTDRKILSTNDAMDKWLNELD